MGNKIKATVVGAALVAGTLLPITAAEAATTQAVQGKVAAVQMAKAPCLSYWDFMWYVALGLQGYRWRC